MVSPTEKFKTSSSLYKSMNIIDKYVSTAEKDKPENKDKIEVDNNTFLLASILTKLDRSIRYKNG